jgi:ribosomal 30S subunit maturation factor RimM
MLSIAKIQKSNGIEGDVLIGLIGIEAEEINTEEPVFISFDGLPVPFFIERLSPRGSSKAIVHLTGVDNLADAEEIVGRDIMLDADSNDQDSEDFTGWLLYNGESLVGEITGLEDIPGNPCLIVEGVLVPLHEDLIQSADPSTRTLVMNLPEGLV